MENRINTNPPLSAVFKQPVQITGNFIQLGEQSKHTNQQHTNQAFSEKWVRYEKTDQKETLYAMQKKWYLALYGFDSEKALASFLQTKPYIFDAGCGLGYKAKWFADLSPESVVIGMDFSASVLIAANNYENTPNLFFMQGDIARTPFLDNVIGYVSCDQVIMHTEKPEQTFKELSRITCENIGEFACYVYAKKALPRELLDEHFRTYCKDLSHDQLWDMSEKLTQLGKTLSELNIHIDVPEIPQLGIKGGKQDLQRFIYWNFIKCFWNQDLGLETSVATNFDWYAPSNAKRFNEQEFKKMIRDNQLNIKHFHTEPACFSGRFGK